MRFHDASGRCITKRFSFWSVQVNQSILLWESTTPTNARVECESVWANQSHELRQIKCGCGIGRSSFLASQSLLKDRSLIRKVAFDMLMNGLSDPYQDWPVAGRIAMRANIFPFQPGFLLKTNKHFLKRKTTEQHMSTLVVLLASESQAGPGQKQHSESLISMPRPKRPIFIKRKVSPNLDLYKLWLAFNFAGLSQSIGCLRQNQFNRVGNYGWSIFIVERLLLKNLLLSFLQQS